jgi:vanillate/3-O-methylgallate O-demethylase
MPDQNLESAIKAAGSAARLLRNGAVSYYKFPYPAEHTNWREEQAAWKETAVLFDQSHHMPDLYLQGPDVMRLLSDVSINTFATFGEGKAKQIVAVNYDGYVIGDAILFGLDPDTVNIVGTPALANWINYRAKHDKYNVEITYDAETAVNPQGRLTFRFQLNGPLTRDIVEKAAGGKIDDIKFFKMGKFDIAGCEVSALNHTMSGVPGKEMTGLEMWGPAEYGPAVYDALATAGAEFGMKLGGAQAYVSAALESGWIALPVSAIYTGERLKSYRESLSASGFAANASLGGSFESDDIEDYYMTPWDLGYGNLISFDHDFIGRDALQAMADKPHRRKVWLRWNDADATRVFAGSLFGGQDRFKYMNLPNSVYGISQYDDVSIDGRTIGLSAWTGYTVNIGGISALASINEADAIDGAEVTVTWGEKGGGSSKPFVERHQQTTVRATVSTTPLGQ